MQIVQGSFWKKWIWNKEDKRKLFSCSYILPFFRDRHNWIWLGLFGLFNITDCVLTQVAVRGTAVEVSPYWYSNVTTPFHLVMKLLVIPALALLVASSIRPSFSKLLVQIIAMGLFVVCCLNTRELFWPSGSGTIEPYTQLEMFRTSLIFCSIGLGILGLGYGLKWLYRRVSG